MDPLGPDPLIRSFERHLDAENRSSRTVTGYLVAVRQADTFLRERGTSLEAATRGDLEAFLGDLLSRRKASTAATYHKVLKILYGWLAEEEEIPANPMAKIKKPIVPEQPVPIVPEEALKRLFQVCVGTTFEARRDTALLMLLLDTGARRAEMGSEGHLQSVRRPSPGLGQASVRLAGPPHVEGLLVPGSPVPR